MSVNLTTFIFCGEEQSSSQPIKYQGPQKLAYLFDCVRFGFFVCALLACILLLTGNLLGDLNKSGSLRAHLLVSFYFYLFCFPTDSENIFCDHLFVCYPFKKRGLAYQENKPQFLCRNHQK